MLLWHTPAFDALRSMNKKPYEIIRIFIPGGHMPGRIGFLVVFGLDLLGQYDVAGGNAKRAPAPAILDKQVAFQHFRIA